jgi:hypothetical protein
MRDARFEHLLSAWMMAEQAFERYAGDRGPAWDPAIRRLMSCQLQKVAWRRYARLCRYVASCRNCLPRL